MLKPEFICFKQNGAISTINVNTLTSVDQFPHLGSYISSTERDVNIGIGKAWTATDRLSTIWKSDLSDKINREFF